MSKYSFDELTWHRVNQYKKITQRCIESFNSFVKALHKKEGFYISVYAGRLLDGKRRVPMSNLIINNDLLFILDSIDCYATIPINGGTCKGYRYDKETECFVFNLRINNVNMAAAIPPICIERVWSQNDHRIFAPISPFKSNDFFRANSNQCIFKLSKQYIAGDKSNLGNVVYMNER